MRAFNRALARPHWVPVIGDHSIASEPGAIPGRDEEMDITEMGENISLAQVAISSAGPQDSMDDIQEQDFDNSVRTGNEAVALAETMRTLEGNVENSMVSMDHRTFTTDYSISDSLNETNITRRDVSIMQVGSRFRPSSSSRDDTVLSLRSLRDETISDDQPQSNLIRAEILQDLERKLIELRDKSAAEIHEVLPKLQAVYPAKAVAVKNMDTRAVTAFYILRDLL
ncbi:hypothetical protein COOONC_12434 [Cooperia oncophora]